MTIRELYNTIDHGRCFITDEHCQPLVCTSVSNQTLAEYHAECEKFRTLANKNEYVVKHIMLLTGNDPCISVELVKEAV